MTAGLTAQDAPTAEIIIAHRLSTVRKGDSLVFLQDGRIGNMGAFEELTASNDTFRNLVELSKL